MTTKQDALQMIAQMIAGTNNGKLMIRNIPAAPRSFVPALIAGAS